MFRRFVAAFIGLIARITRMNRYALLQKLEYRKGTSDHIEHNSNPDLGPYLLFPAKAHAERSPRPAILDLGCGQGRNISNLRDLGFAGRIDGADISKANISACRARFSGMEGDYFTTNGLDLSPFPSKEYDVVFSTIVLQHIPVWSTRDGLLRECHRVLKEGGLLVFQMGYGATLQTPRGTPLSSYWDDDKSVIGSNGTHDVQVQNSQDVERHLHAIGFTSVECEIREAFSDHQHDNWIFVRATRA